MLIVLHLPMPGVPLTAFPSPPHCCPQVELSDGTSHTITDAYAGKEYIIQVAAKDNDIGTWSDWSVAVHATPWTEEPKHLTTEAQITGETPSSSTVCPHSGGGPGVMAEGPPCLASASLFHSQRDTPSTWGILQPFTLHFAPTHGSGSRYNHGLSAADSACLSPASSSPGYLGSDNEAGGCFVFFFFFII